MEQRTEEWFAMRYGKIGGTASKSLHIPSATLLYELAACRMEVFEYEESYPTSAMQRGIDLEPMAFEQASRYLGKKFLDFGWIESSDTPLIGYSPDGLTITGKDGLELKCPSAKVHMKYLAEGVIPLDYVHQIVHAFAVNEKLERMHFASFRPECEVQLFVITVCREDEINMGTEKRIKMQVIGEVAKEKVTLATSLDEEIKQLVNTIKF